MENSQAIVANSVAKPVITIDSIKPANSSIRKIRNSDGTITTKEIKNFTILFRKVINTTRKDLMDLGFRRMGDPNISGGEKNLTFNQVFTEQTIESAGFVEGVDVNTLGFPVVYDLREVYVTELTADGNPYFPNELNKNVQAVRPGGLDQNYNVTATPVINPSEGKVLLTKGKMVFRFVELVSAPTVEELPQSEPKPVYDRQLDAQNNIVIFNNRPVLAGFEDFEGVQRDNNRRKTPEYQAFLNAAYSMYNDKTTPIITQSAPIATAVPNLVTSGNGEEINNLPF